MAAEEYYQSLSSDQVYTDEESTDFTDDNDEDSIEV